MQINPFGLPLGAGMQSTPNMGGAGLGFADALGLAVQGGAGPAPAGLIASTSLPGNFTARLSQTLLAQAQLDAQPMPATTALPGLQQPTPLSQLMATAAKLPTTEAVPGELPIAEPAPIAEVATPDMPPATAVVETAPEAPAPAPAVPEQTAMPAKAAAGLTPPVQKPAGEAGVSDEPLPGASETATPTEVTPAKPQKGPRARVAVAEAEPLQPNAPQAAVPADMLATTVVPQPIAQPQVAPREATPQAGSPTSGVKKVALAGAPAADAPQASAAATPDFARAVAAKGESAGSEANADGQPQADPQLAAFTKTDAAAPTLPHAAHNAPATTPTAATPAAAPAEPVIEARAGHLGHSLGVEIARKVELGEETMRIRLNPIELGRIEVTLAFDDKGSLQATVRTESAQAMDLLRQDAGDLARTLDQAGVRTDAQSFRFENRGGDSGGQQAQQQQSRNNGAFASSDDDAALAEPIYRAVRSDGQVDLLA